MRLWRRWFSALIFNAPSSSAPGGLKPSRAYHPDPPMGFVRRSDPNFYFLSRR